MVIDQNLHRVVELRRRHLSMYRLQPTNWQTGKVGFRLVYLPARYPGRGACDLRLGYFGFHAVHCTRVGERKDAC